MPGRRGALLVRSTLSACACRRSPLLAPRPPTARTAVLCFPVSVRPSVKLCLLSAACANCGGRNAGMLQGTRLLQIKMALDCTCTRNPSKETTSYTSPHCNCGQRRLDQRRATAGVAQEGCTALARPAAGGTRGRRGIGGHPERSPLAAASPQRRCTGQAGAAVAPRGRRSAPHFGQSKLSRTGRSTAASS